MGRAGLVVAVFLCLLGAAAPARAQCNGLVNAGPLIAGPGATDFGQIPEACPGTDLFLRLRAEVLADPSDFYGVITGGTTLRGRWQFWPRWTLTAAFDPVTVRYPINAVLTSTGVGVGPATLGGQRTFVVDRLVLAPYARLLLPFDSARHRGTRWGGELGVSASYRFCTCGGLRAGLSAPATLTTVGDYGHGIFAPGALVEGVWAPRVWVAFSGGVAARAQAAPHGYLQAVAARASARLETRRGWHVALAADVPFAGDDRTDVTATIFVGRSGPREAF